MMLSITSEIKALAKQEGVNLIGVAPARGWKEIARGYKPTDVLSDARTVIVMANQTPDRIIEEGKPSEKENAGAVAREKADRAGAKIVGVLIKNGYFGVPVEPYACPLGDLPSAYRTPEFLGAFERHPSQREHLRGEIPLKYAAYKAGLGVIGKSSLLITPQYGPRVHLAAIVTNAALAADKPMDVDFCGGCSECERVCIGKSIQEGRYDPDKCWRAEWELGVPIPGYAFKICLAACMRYCPVWMLKEKYRPSRAQIKPS
jgi:epoxyqueuosine reductase